MPANSLTILFCEDVRDEDGNKTSFMGVLGSRMIVPAMPGQLGKLCIALLADVEGREGVNVRCKVTSANGPNLPPPLETTVEPSEKAEAWSFKIVLAMQNLPFARDASIDVEFSVDDQTIYRSLRVLAGVLTPGTKDIISAGSFPQPPVESKTN